MTPEFIKANNVKMPAPKSPIICECCGELKYAAWNPSLGWYWVHH